MMFFVRHLREEDRAEQIPAGWFEALNKRTDLPMTSVWPNGPGGNALKIKVPIFDSTDTESMTNAEIFARRRMMQVIDYYQRVEKKNWKFDHCSAQIGIREGRRAVGDYILKLEDLRAGRKFDDAIARGVFYLDGHKPDDDKRTYILAEEERYVPPYQIPFKSLLVKDAQNLMVAGRCFSAEQLALSSARVTTSCSMMGQAAGLAAAESAKNEIAPRDLGYRKVRKSIEEYGANLAV